MNGAIEFSYRGGVLRYNPETGQCWRGVDVADWELVRPGTAGGYTILSIKGVQFKLHRVIAEVFLNRGKPIPKYLVVDHIWGVNGSHSQDRLENLRLVTTAENCRNRGIGNLRLSQHPVTGLWQIRVAGALTIIGTYKSELEAGLAYLRLPKGVRG